MTILVIKSEHCIKEGAFSAPSLGEAHRGRRLWVTAAATITLGDPAALGPGYAGGIAKKTDEAVTVTAPRRLLNSKSESYTLVGEDQGALFEVGPDGGWHLSGDVEVA